MTLVPLPLPYQLTNGTTADATQVMADLNSIADSVNTNVPTAISTAIAGISGGGTGQCKLVYTNANTITLTPWNGSNLVISGGVQPVPAGGITLTDSGLAASTLYYIYAYMNSSTMTLVASATGYTTDASGYVVENGASDHSLVGMIYTTAGSQFVDTGTNRFVRSWFNETGVTGSQVFASDKTTSSGSFVELDSPTRANMILWNNERVHINLYSQQASTGTGMGTAIGFNSASTASARVGISTPDTGGRSVCVNFNASASVGETFNYTTILGLTTGGTGTWAGNNQNTGITYITQRR